ncbi:MAG: metallophosphoesterase [Nanoarchaeota archaeon]
MSSSDILKFCLQKGVLVDKDILNLFNETGDLDSIKLIIEKIKSQTQTKIITKNTFETNKEKFNDFFLNLPEENKKSFESLKIKLGLNIEISKEFSIEKKSSTNIFTGSNVKIISTSPDVCKSFEVKDFVNYFRNRFNEMRNVLQEHSELDKLVSIGKISGSNQKLSIIGIVYDKRITKNKNIILDIEDLTGRMKVLINQNKPELYSLAEEITLDSIIGFKGSGNKDILFVNEVIFLDSVLPERKKSFVEEYALFIGDLHYGSKRFLKDNFLKFIDYLNGNVPNTPEVSKIKYLFIAGDVVTGVGNYPNQEPDLSVVDLEEQFIGITELLKKIRKDIKIIISPGNHDCVRLMEPQPIFDEKFAWPLYELENVIVTKNPSTVNIGATENFSGFNVLNYHGFSYFYYTKNLAHLIKQKAANKPELIMSYLLKNRHLAPTHTSVQYAPTEKDYHFIKEIPDIFVSGHVHKSAVSYYNNILIVSTSCWEAMTPYMEKMGSIPDFCKVPMVNLKTRAVKILDFE